MADDIDGDNIVQLAAIGVFGFLAWKVVQGIGGTGRAIGSFIGGISDFVGGLWPF